MVACIFQNNSLVILHWKVSLFLVFVSEFPSSLIDHRNLGCEITAEGVFHLSKFISKIASSLEELDLSYLFQFYTVSFLFSSAGNKFGNQGCNNLKEGLNEAKKLKKLCLKGITPWISIKSFSFFFKRVWNNTRRNWISFTLFPIDKNSWRIGFKLTSQ